MALVLQKQWDYYLSKEEEFLKECYGKFLVINEALDVVVMDTIGDAYKLGTIAYGLGHFLIQECVERKPECIRTTSSAVLGDIRVVMTENGPRFARKKKGGTNA